MILKRYIEAVPGFSTIGKMPTLLPSGHLTLEQR